MKRVELAKVVVLGLMLSVAVVGCQKNPRGITPIPGQTRTIPEAGPIDINGQPIDERSGSARRTGDDPNVLAPRGSDADYNFDRAAFKEQTVYFDFDSATIRPGERAKIKAVADYLTREPTTMVRVEGHCDERGTDGYNMALGERRALAAREQLIADGVAGDRVSTISYGEEQPAVLGNDDNAWSKNRRGEFILMRPK